jgi:anti-sigma factor RsiW
MTTSNTPSDLLTAQMHAVLDGTASPAQQDALDATLAASPEAAEEFATWQAMFRTMAAMPMAHPPEGLVAAISAALPIAKTARAETFSKPDQLFVSSSVIASGQTKSIRMPSGFRAFFRRPNGPVSTQEFGQMNANRKIWAGGAVAAVALGVAFFATQYPPKPENVIGTVAPAERYRAPQADAVKLGDQTTATSSSPSATDAAGPQAAKADAQLMADKVSAEKMAEKTSAEMMAEKSSARMMAEKNSAQMMAEKSNAKMVAEKNSAEMMAEKNTAKMMADRGVAEKNSQAEHSAERSVAAERNIAADRALAERALAERGRAERSANAVAEKADAAAKAEKGAASLQSADRSSSKN